MSTSLQELSREYAAGANAIAERIVQLRAALASARGCAEEERLRRRIERLQPLLYEARETALYMARYYDSEGSGVHAG